MKQRQKRCHCCGGRHELPDGWYCDDCDPEITGLPAAWALDKAFAGKYTRTKRGLTLNEYAAMLDGAECEICGATEGWNGKALCVDHCHNTGENRGMLCNHCNSLIGFARDNPSILEKAIEYLSTHASK